MLQSQSSSATTRTKKEAVLLAEAFVRSAYLGLRIVKNDKAALGSVRGSLGGLVLSQITSEFDILEQPSRQDVQNAVTWTLAQPRLGLTVRQGKLLYLRGYVRLPWKELAVRFSMSWDRVRAEYDETALTCTRAVTA